MDATALLLDGLGKRGEAYRKNLKQARTEFSSDTVHDLRTSLRRLLATLDVIAFFTSAARVEKLSTPLKEQLDRFSDLRDIQVMRDRVAEDIGQLPDLEPFQVDLKKHEKRQQRKDEKRVGNLKPGSVKRQLVKLQETLTDLSAAELNETKLPQPIDQTYLTVLQRYAEIDPAQPVSIHHLRVAFKNFRYMVEEVYPCLPDFPETLLTQLHGYQTQMGNIHDTQVLLETLANYIEGSGASAAHPYHFYEQSLADQIAAFVKKKANILHFWRATPITAFPWQAHSR